MEEPKYGWWFPPDVSVHGHEIDAIKLARGGGHGERLRPNNPDSPKRTLVTGYRSAIQLLY